VPVSFEELEKIFQEALTAGVPEDNFSLGEMVRAAARMKNDSKLEEYWRRIEKLGAPTVGCFNLLMDAYNVIGSPEKVDSVYNNLKAAGLTPDLHSETSRLKSARGNDDKVRQIMKEAETAFPTLNAHFYAALISHASSLGNIEEIERLVDQMITNGITHNNATLNELLNIYQRTRNFERAIKVYEDAKRDGLRMSSNNFEKALLAAAKMGNVIKLDEIFSTMQNERVRFSIFAFNALIEGYQRGSEFQRAWSVYERVLRNKKDQPNAGTFAAIISACGFHHQPEKLQQVLERMRERMKPNAALWHAIISAEMRNRELPKAVQGLLDMKEQGIPWQVRHRNALILGLRKGDYPENFQTLVESLYAVKDEREMDPESLSKFEELIRALRI